MYVPAFKCLDCEAEGRPASWSSSYRAFRYFAEEARTQRERIEAAHRQYRPGHRVVKVRTR